jgi:tRNA(fMet)-specific endonuclease VapC
VTWSLDTNTVTHLFKGRGRVAEHLLRVAPKDVEVSAVVVHELATGVARSLHAARQREELRRFLQSIRVIALGAEEAEAAAVVRADLATRGQPIGPLDVLIAGTALARGATLVTSNVGEFGRVTGLRIEDWYVGFS